MKLSRNKVVYFSIVASILIFIIAYGVSVFENDKETEPLSAPEVPVPSEEEVQYKDRLEAIDKIEAEREMIIPDIYDAEPDTAGVDSILTSFDDTMSNYPDPEVDRLVAEYDQDFSGERPLREQAEGYDGQKQDPIFSRDIKDTKAYQDLRAVVFTDQVVRSGDRLKLLLSGLTRDKGDGGEATTVYGICRVNGNRVDIDVSLGDGRQWKAFDLLDHQEGLYIKNQRQGISTDNVAREISTEIQVPGIPFIPRIRNLLFQPKRGTKVQLRDQYEFILKPKL